MPLSKPTSITRRDALKTIAGATAFGGASGIVDAQSGGTAQPAEAANQTCNFNAIYDETITSVVTVRTFDQQGERGEGSGWVYESGDSVGYVVTNWHVIAAIVGADVRFSSGEWRPVGELVGIDPYADLAVLRVEDFPGDVDPVAVTDSLPDEGDDVAALGSPLGLEGSIATGTVSALNRSTTIGYGESVYTVTDTIQTDAAINPGNSGGPLVNCAGDVVGVNFAGVEFFVGQNVNFAVSATMIERVVPELIETGTFEHPYVGIRGVTLSPTIARLNELEETTGGVIVTGTIAGYPASEVVEASAMTERVTGLPVGGDVIVAVDGTPVESTDALQIYLFANARPDDTITLTVVRNGERREIDLPLTAKPHPLERVSASGPSI